MDRQAFDDRVAALCETLRAKLGTRGATLGTRLRRAGRRLPRHARRAGAEILRAQGMADHPRLWRLVDTAAIEAAFDTLDRSLKPIDPRARRKDMALGIAGSVVFSLLMLGVGIVLLLKWRGLI